MSDVNYFGDVNSDLNPYSSTNSSSTSANFNPYSSTNYGTDTYGFETEGSAFNDDEISFQGTDTDLNSGYNSTFNPNNASTSRSGGGGSSSNQGAFGVKWKDLFGGLGGALGGLGGFLGAKDAAEENARIEKAKLDFAIMKEQARQREQEKSIARRFGGIEPEVTSDAAGVFRELRNLAPSGEQLFAIGRGIQESFAPTLTQSARLVQNLFSGEQERQRLEAANAEKDANFRAAQSAQRGVDVSLQNVLSRIAADNARRGFVGTSSADNSRLLRDTVPLNAAADNIASQAALQNAQLDRNIREDNIVRQMDNIGLPLQVAENLFQFETFPEEAARNAVARALSVRGASFDSLRAGDITPGIPFGTTSGASIFSQPIVKPGVGTALSATGKVLSEREANKRTSEAIERSGTNNQTGITTGGTSVV